MPSYERLTAFDASFLEIEDAGTHMHVAAVLLFDAGPLLGEDGGLDIERIRAFVESRLHQVPRYRQRLLRTPLEEHPVWVDDVHFNLQYHVRHTCLPRPGDERQLKRLAGRILSQKLDEDKPLWEMWFVEGLEGGRFALITKAHHCMIDGISGVDVLATILRPDADSSIEAPPRWVPRPPPGRLELLRGEIGRRAAAPWRLAWRAGRALGDPTAAVGSLRESASAVAETLGTGLRATSETPLNPPHIGPHRRFDHARFELGAVKDVKNRVGGTVNDVVIATAAGAVARFLRMRGLPVEDLFLRALIPVSLRSDAERGALGNRVAMLLAPLPVSVADPVERLRRVTEQTTKLKRSRQPQGMEIIEGLGEWTSTTLIDRIVRLAARTRSYNLVITNVPGPQQLLYLLGARMLEPYPMVPLYSNQALGAALFSYDGGLFWGLNSDWDRVPDLHRFVEGLYESFEELVKAAQQH